MKWNDPSKFKYFQNILTNHIQLEDKQSHLQPEDKQSYIQTKDKQSHIPIEEKQSHIKIEDNQRETTKEKHPSPSTALLESLRFQCSIFISC